ncbi:hypothetical protein BCY84_06212 [Trypanosoma cruzi cruzi]|nr:hypothetical protein BCY84_06212 [Trypanosoma cruzi cruzi]
MAPWLRHYLLWLRWGSPDKTANVWLLGVSLGSSPSPARWTPVAGAPFRAVASAQQGGSLFVVAASAVLCFPLVL